MFRSILAFLFIILVCVIVHEAGHYLSALLFGVKVHEFSFGMGPLIVGWQGRKNKWSVRIFPVGGFVRLAGMGEEDEGENVLPGESFVAKAPLKRLIILAAGSFNNILLVVILATFLLMTRGVVDMSTAEVGAVMSGFPADQAGLKSGDIIRQIGGTPVSDWEEMTREIRTQARNHERLVLDVLRGTEHLTLTLGTKAERPDGVPLIGIQPAIKTLSLAPALRRSLSYTFNLSLVMLKGLKEIFTHPTRVDVSGPVGIAAMAGQAAQAGFFSLLSFLAIISLNLGIVNLLPFPALDGGHIIFVLGEIIVGRKLPCELESKIHFLGFVVLATLIVFITWQDILKFLE